MRAILVQYAFPYFVAVGSLGYLTIISVLKTMNDGVNVHFQINLKQLVLFEYYCYFVEHTQNPSYSHQQSNFSFRKTVTSHIKHLNVYYSVGIFMFTIKIFTLINFVVCSSLN